MKKDLVKLANHLDSKGLTKEADYVDELVKSASLGGQTYYILYQGIDYEESVDLLGAYPSMEKAQAAKDAVKDRIYRGTFLKIEEVSFDPSIEMVVDRMYGNWLCIKDW